MKISTYYKQKGYKIEWYSPLFHNKYYKIFASKVFNWNSVWDDYIRKDIIVGGSGYSLETRLPDKIEHIYPDYELYDIDYALGFLTRGCIRKCPFCIVWRKEGKIIKNADLEEFCKDQTDVVLLDNNFLAYENHVIELEKLLDTGKRFDFNQGLDIRLITKENAFLLKKLRRIPKTHLRFALDDVKLIPVIKKKLEILFDVGIKPTSMMFYVLVGFNSTEEDDLERINFLKKQKIKPYVMPFDKTDQYQKMIRDWVNYKPIFWKSTFETFKSNYSQIKRDGLAKTMNYIPKSCS